MARRAATPGPAAGPPSVVVVEDWSHWPYGHFPVRYLELAEGFRAAGAWTVALTAAGPPPERDRPSTVPTPRYGPVARVLHWSALRLRGLERSPGTAVPPLRNRTSRALRAAAMAVAVRSTRRQLRRAGAGESVVVSVAFALPVRLTDLLVGGPRFVMHVYGQAPLAPASGLGVLSRLIGHRRTRRGRTFVVAVHSGQWVEGWQAFLPWSRAAELTVSGSPPMPRDADARRALGIDPDRLVLLSFGASHPDKDLATVARAVRVLAERHPDRPPLLLAAGGLSDEVAATLVEHAGPWLDLRRGSVDDATRARFYSAADVVVLSFIDGHARDSGTWTDAVAAGVPVVTSDRSLVGALTRRWSFGEVFEPGDAGSLADAVDRLERPLPAEVVAAARADQSDETLARRHLALFGLDGAAPTDSP